MLFPAAKIQTFFESVKVTAGSTFGGVDDKRRVVVTDHTHTLYISGSCVFSGIEIK